jgi:hypothetical protein
MLLIILGALSRECREKKFDGVVMDSYTDSGNPPEGSKIQPRSDSHRNTTVPLPSKQEEVKPNRHLGDMPAVNKVPEKQREDMCPKSHGGNSAYVPKPHE